MFSGEEENKLSSPKPLSRHSTAAFIGFDHAIGSTYQTTSRRAL